MSKKELTKEELEELLKEHRNKEQTNRTLNGFAWIILIAFILYMLYLFAGA